jgi:hypothetical protein
LPKNFGGTETQMNEALRKSLEKRLNLRWHMDMRRL